jgi:hypothetical protein
MSDSLWPDLPRERIKTPHSILLEQANFLGEKTRGLLVGRVKRTQDEEGLYSTLMIVVPALNNYSYAVCRIDYPISLYPCRLYSLIDEARYAITNEDQLTEGLKDVLGSAELKRVMTGLLAQVQADEDAKPRTSRDEVPF